MITALDECDLEIDDCSNYAICKDVDVGIGYTCECYDGYVDEYLETAPGIFCKCIILTN